MTFIEQLFGLTPDGGNGVVEASIIILLAWAIALLTKRRRVGLRRARR